MDSFRVVVADDFADIRHLMRLTLERSGRFQIVGEAVNGAEAITLAQELEPDLLLLDLSMPVLSGLEALPRIREASPATKVVVLSGLDRAQMEPEALEGGPAGYLEKGLRPGHLAAGPLAVARLRGRVEGAAD